MKLKITLTGKVHEVGYRLFLLNQDDSLLINSFDACNVFIDDKKALIALVEGNEEQIKDFLEFIKSEKPEKAVVDDIRVEEYKGSVRTIESYRNSLRLEQINNLVQAGVGILEKQDKMLEKQDETVKVIKEESEKIRTHLGGKIDDLRSDLKDYLDERLKKVEEDIRAIKSRIGMA